MKNKKKKRIHLMCDWVISRRLTGKQTQRILILGQAAGLKREPVDSFYENCEVFPYICTVEGSLDMVASTTGYNIYNYTEVLNALVRKIKRNKYKHKS